MYVRQGARREVRAQSAGVGSHLPSRESQGLNSGCQFWQQAPLPAETSRQRHGNHFLH